VIGGSRWLATAPLVANLCIDSGHFYLSRDAVCDAMSRVRRNGNHINPVEGSFAACPTDNVDYAVMKKSSKVAVAAASMCWSRLGSWDALHDIGYKDANENVSSGTVWLDGGHRSLVYADGVSMSVHHVDNLLIIANGNEVDL
jgi:mannose-1-phosphate guanylyltransferase/mannose-1-phosphate guanylyltransferase/mannose-6-phosphate isomerase